MSSFYFEIEDYQLEKAARLLAGIPGGVQKAVGSALKRSAQHGLTIGMKIVAEEYAIGQNVLKNYTHNINSVVRDGAGSYDVTFGYRGSGIPLIRFDTSVSRDGRVSARVLRSSAREAFDHAFRATLGGHTGIYERLGPKRFPVEEKFGPSGVQAFYARESTTDKMDEAINEMYNKRIDHEITRVLNGWGV